MKQRILKSRVHYEMLKIIQSLIFISIPFKTEFQTQDEKTSVKLNKILLHYRHIVR